MLTRRTMHGIVASRSAGKLHIIPSGGCAESSSCDHGCGSCNGKKSAGEFIVASPDAYRFPPGSRVVVTTFMPGEAMGALIVFGIPLLFATGALLVRHMINPSTVESPASLIGAGCAFAAGFAVVGLIDRLLRRRYPPSVKIDDGASPAIPPDGAGHHG